MGIPIKRPEHLSCLNITTHIDHRFGGLTTSVPSFCEAIESTGRYRAPLGAFCLEDEQSASAEMVAPPMIFPLGRLRWMFDRGAKQRLISAIQDASLVHIHGIWQEHCSLTAAASQKLRRPYIVSAHGMLDPWALRNKKWKKDLYWALFEKGNLMGARCVRALTLAEAEHYHGLGLRRPVAVIPNGVSVPDEIDVEPFFQRFPDLRGRRILLFLGRIHYKKGLDLLCRAWADLSAAYPDAQLVLAGPDSEGTRATIEALVSELGVESRVTLTGMLRGSEKWAALKAAAAFVLPSYSEGFSVAVLEAMGVATPVVISTQCYFPEVQGHHCGWVIATELDALKKALRESLELSGSERASMGARGRNLVRSRFSWPVIGKQAADLFDWILGGTPPSSLGMITNSR